jgi:tetratricopeptide (TPR) repeat protein
VAGFFLRIGQTAEAKKYVEHIIGIQQPREELAQAKRLLAFILATESTTYEEKRKLLADLGFLDEDPDTKAAESPDDKRMRALLLVNQGRRRDRVEAIRALEEVSQLQPLTTDDQFVLAQLHESLGNKAKAQSLMQSIINKAGDNPRYVGRYIRSLLAQNELGEAGIYIASLEKLQPKAGQTFELKARWLHAQGKTSEAVSLLEKFAEEKDAPLLAIANLLELIEDKPKKSAEQMFKKLVDKVDKEKKPDAVLLLAGFLGRNGRLAESLDLFDQVRAQRGTERILGGALLVLYRANSGKADRERVESWIQEALQDAKSKRDAKRQTALEQSLATLYNLEGRVDEAEKLYRRCVEDDPRDYLARNNLAWLLATRQGGNADEALAQVQRALDIAGPLPALLDTRALIYLVQGKNDLAIKELEDIVADNPTGVGLFRLAQAYHAVNNTLAAREQLRRALTTYNLKQTDLEPFERNKFEQLCTALDVK